MNNKKIFFIVLGLIVLLIIFFLFFIYSKKNNNLLNQQVNLSLENKNQPKQDDIIVDYLSDDEKISSPLKISGKARGFWFFEAQFTAELYDENNNLLGQAILTAQDDWMTENFVPFEGELNFSNPQSKKGVLKFLSANPSGELENQKIFIVNVLFDNQNLQNNQIKTKKVLLYYYNPEKDKDSNGNILCSEKGILPIEREIAINQSPIKDTIKLLLKGKQNLTANDIKQGFQTEFPLDGFELKSVNLKSDGILILEFNDLFNKTSGGSCRTNILKLQIEKTAKQFLEVKKIEILPKYLFQP